MARNDDVNLSAGTWTQLTNGDATASSIAGASYTIRIVALRLS